MDVMIANESIYMRLHIPVEPVLFPASCKVAPEAITGDQITLEANYLHAMNRSSAASWSAAACHSARSAQRNFQWIRAGRLGCKLAGPGFAVFLAALPARARAFCALMGPALSLCLVVKNEEQQLAMPGFGAQTGHRNHRRRHRLERCNAQNRSTDGAKISTFDFTTVDFAAARNYAMKQAQTAWILMLDADETLCRNRPDDPDAGGAQRKCRLFSGMPQPEHRSRGAAVSVEARLSLSGTGSRND